MASQKLLFFCLCSVRVELASWCVGGKALWLLSAVFNHLELNSLNVSHGHHLQ